MKTDLSEISMNRIARLRAEAELHRAEAIVELVSRAVAATKRWSKMLVDSVRRGRRQAKAPAMG